jgi:2-C-methyl-D-erythritol 4-phosphate cytidylyltransferase
MKSFPSYFAVIPAAGKGERYSAGKSIVKQHVDLNGKSILEWSIEPFVNHKNIRGVLVVLSPDDPHIHALKKNNYFIGGGTRAETVLNGIRSLGLDAQPNDWILVHDAVRPMISEELIDRLIKAVKNNAEGGLLACRLTDTVKRSDTKNRVNSTLDRKELWSAQTPQIFRKKDLETALSSSGGSMEITDESSAIETLGIKPLLVESELENFKVTYAHDLVRAKMVFQERNSRKAVKK